jgi:2-hydroxycyclohexanecarboxyl-CoA dehydrogenase
MSHEFAIQVGTPRRGSTHQHDVYSEERNEPQPVKRYFLIAKANAEKVRDEVQALGVEATTCPVDLTKKAEIDRMVSEVLARFGQVDILVNGQGWDRLEPFVESNEETWEKLLAINFKSVLYATKAVLPQMISHGGGKIVNISSDAGSVGSSWEAVYAGAKGAVIAFSKTVAREV